jgi:hypothetical protein
VNFIDLTLLNPNVVIKLPHQPPLSREGSLNSKIIFLVKYIYIFIYISGKADLVGQIAANVFVETTWKTQP